MEARSQNSEVRIVEYPPDIPWKSALWISFERLRMFLAFILTPDSRAGMGFAVNRKAQTKRAVEEIAQEVAQGITHPLNDSDIEQVETLITGLHQLKSSIDPQFVAIINDELGPFFSGQKSAAEVAKLIQSKAATYLQE